jgi:hypothetical protein
MAMVDPTESKKKKPQYKNGTSALWQNVIQKPVKLGNHYVGV